MVTVKEFLNTVLIVHKEMYAHSNKEEEWCIENLIEKFSEKVLAEIEGDL